MFILKLETEILKGIYKTFKQILIVFEFFNDVKI